MGSKFEPQIPNNKESCSGEDDLQVRSDSAYLNDCMHTYIHKWLDNDWITVQGEFHQIGHSADIKLGINDCFQGMKRFIVNHLKIFGSSWILSLLILFGLNEKVGFHWTVFIMCNHGTGSSYDQLI